VINVGLTGGSINIVPLITAAGAWPVNNVKALFIPLVYNTAQTGAIPLNQGAIVYDSTNKYIQFYNGTAWNPIGTGSGSGIVNPGTINCPFSYYPSTNSAVSPTAMYMDCATKTIPYLTQGIANQALNYTNPYKTNNPIYPFQVPFTNNYAGDKPYSLHDFWGAKTTDFYVNGTCSFQLVSTDSCGGDWAYDYANMYINSPIQGGGFHDYQIVQNSPGDGVYTSLTSNNRGITEGFHEGNEYERIFMGFDYNPEAGILNLLGTDFHGNAQIQLTSGSALNGAGTDNLLINKSRTINPTGDVVGILNYTGDSRFIELDVNSTLKTSLDGLLGTTLHIATVVAGADLQKYDGNCPATVIAANWGNYTAPGGTLTAIDPYNTNPDGSGGLTYTQCLTTSGDTSSLIASTSRVSIWGAHDNWESALVVSRPDSTHLVLSLHRPHDPGELITWGAGVGLGVSSTKSTILAGTLTSSSKIQYSDIHVTFPIVGYSSSGSKLIVYTNSSAAQTELKMNLYNTTTPILAGTATPTIVAGVVTAVSMTTNNYQNTGSANSYLWFFPPPTYTFGGSSTCSLLPTFQWVRGAAGTYKFYDLKLLTGGSGCPSDFSIMLQTTWANSIFFYPVTRTYKVQDPITFSPSTGYILAYPLMDTTKWITGDLVETTPNTNMYVANNRQFAQSPFVRNSRRYGPSGVLATQFPQNGVGLDYWANQTPDWYYDGDVTTGYQASNDPTKALYAQGVPPTIREVGGAWNHAFVFHTFPHQGLGITESGAIFRVECQAQGQDGPANNPSCQRIVPDLTWLESQAPSGFIQQIKSSTVSQTWNVIGGTLQNNSINVCLSNGINCPTATKILFKLAGTGTIVANQNYYLGDPPVLTTDNSVSSRSPVACTVSGLSVYVTEIVASGSPPVGIGTDLPSFTLYKNGVSMTTQSLTIWSTAGQHSSLLNVAGTIAVGDLLQVFINTPNWSVNPTGPIAFSTTIYCY